MCLKTSLVLVGKRWGAWIWPSWLSAREQDLWHSGTVQILLASKGSSELGTTSISEHIRVRDCLLIWLQKQTDLGDHQRLLTVPVQSGNGDAAEDNIKLLCWGGEWHLELHIFSCCLLFSGTAFLCIVHQTLFPSASLLQEQADLSLAGRTFVLGLWLIVLHLPSQERDLLACTCAVQWTEEWQRVVPIAPWIMILKGVCLLACVLRTPQE